MPLLDHFLTQNRVCLRERERERERARERALSESHALANPLLCPAAMGGGRMGALCFCLPSPHWKCTSGLVGGECSGRPDSWESELSYLRGGLLREEKMEEKRTHGQEEPII